MKFWHKIPFLRIHVDRQSPKDIFAENGGPYFWHLNQNGTMRPGVNNLSCRRDNHSNLLWHSWIWAHGGLRWTECWNDCNEEAAIHSMSMVMGGEWVITMRKSIERPIGL